MATPASDARTGYVVHSPRDEREEGGQVEHACVHLQPKTSSPVPLRLSPLEQKMYWYVPEFARERSALRPLLVEAAEHLVPKT